MLLSVASACYRNTFITCSMLFSQHKVIRGLAVSLKSAWKAIDNVAFLLVVGISRIWNEN